MSDKLQTKFNELLKIVLDDIRYKTVNHTYNIKNGVLENRQEINTILVNVGTYIKYMTSKLDIYKDVECIIDYAALYDVFRRYSRDVWGYKRMNYLISHLSELSGSVYKKHVLEELQSSGLKVVSKRPYIERKCAYLLYWLCKIRPFRLKFNNANIEQFHETYVSYNEMISFLFVKHILMVHGCNFKIKNEAFNDIVRDMHYRIIGRTSLELLLTSLVNTY